MRIRGLTIHKKDKNHIQNKIEFQLVIITTILGSIGSWILIVLDLNLELCWTAQCLDDFVEIFNIPLNIIWIGTIATGLVFAYYRIELHHQQINDQLTINAAQLKQLNFSNYKAFHNEFLELMKEEGGFRRTKISNRKLFECLYPTSKKGENIVHEDFVKYMNNPTPEYGYLALTLDFDRIKNSMDDSRYDLKNYEFINNHVSFLTKIIPLTISQSKEIENELADLKEKLEYYWDVFIDLSKITFAVNELEALIFFDNATKMQIQQILEWFAKIRGELNNTYTILEGLNNTINDHLSGDNYYANLNAIFLSYKLSTKTVDNIPIKKFIFNYIKRVHKESISDEDYRLLKRELGLI